MSVIEGGSVSRRELRHMILRRRNERVVANRHAALMPTVLRMHPETRYALLRDDDPNERWALDFEGDEFLGIPIFTDASLELWTVDVTWPEDVTVE